MEALERNVGRFSTNHTFRSSNRFVISPFPVTFPFLFQKLEILLSRRKDNTLSELNSTTATYQENSDRGLQGAWESLPEEPALTLMLPFPFQFSSLFVCIPSYPSRSGPSLTSFTFTGSHGQPSN